jgi:hypothetical protein
MYDMDPDIRTPEADLIERTLTVEDVMRFARPWLFGATVAIIGIHALLHGVRAPESATSFLVAVGILLGAYVVSVVIHEVLHVLAMLVFGRVSAGSIEWGHRISEGIVYVHTTEPMSVRAYRGVLALPGIVTGIIPVLIAWLTGSWLLVLYGWLMTTSAVGDLAIHRLIRDLDPSALVRDHPEQVGVLLMETGDGGESNIEN